MQREPQLQVATDVSMVGQTKKPSVNRLGYFLSSNTLWSIHTSYPFRSVMYGSLDIQLMELCSIVLRFLESAPASVQYHLQQTAGGKKLVHSLCGHIHYTSK